VGGLRRDASADWPGLAAAFVAALFLPRKRWAWVCHMVLICLGLTGCFFPASLPLLLFFIKPETQAYFNS
jgi:hypothetical protein